MVPPVAGAAHLSRVRTLYKRILVLHGFMPAEMRALGDRYVKEEFRRHKTASESQARLFVEEWDKYRETLQSQVLGAAGARAPAFGAALSEQDLRDFQDDQVGQLYQLMLESTRPSLQLHVGEGEEGEGGGSSPRI